jgi:FkbM family methyltransferase
MISYAQNFEDVLLARAFHNQTTGFFIDVGAADPVEHSVSKHFSLLGWRGINIEPLRNFHEKLVADRPQDVNLNVALGATPGQMPFFNVGGAYLSTLDPTNAQKAQEAGIPTTQEFIQVMTLAEVCEQFASNVTIDFLKVDVEGWEESVLRGGDFQRFRPRVIIVEATEPKNPNPTHGAWEPILLQAGYSFAHFDGLNRFYVRHEDDALKQHFVTPPNVYDEFQVYREYRFEQDLIRLYAERDQLSTQYGEERIAHEKCRQQRDEYYAGREANAKEIYTLTQQRDQARYDLDQRSQERDYWVNHHQDLTHQYGVLLQNRDDLINERNDLTSQLEELVQERRSLKEVVANLNNRIELKHQEYLNLTYQYDALRNDRDYLQAQVQDLRQHLDKLYSSRFWRYTAPIRGFGNWCVRVARKIKRTLVGPRTPEPVQAVAPTSPAPTVKHSRIKHGVKQLLRKCGGNRLVALIDRRVLAHLSQLPPPDNTPHEKIAQLEAEIAKLHQRALMTEICLEALIPPVAVSDKPVATEAPPRKTVHQSSTAA